MAGLTGAAAFGYVGYQRETTKGQFVTPTEFLFVQSHALNAVADVIRKEVFSGTRAAQRILKPAKFKLGGNLMHPLYGNMGTPFFLCSLGLEMYLAAVSITGTAFTTSTTVNNGLTTFTASSTAGLKRGAWIAIGTGATQEIRQIVSIVGSTVGVSRLEVTANQSAATLSCVQIAQHQFTTIPPTSVSPLPMDLPTMSIETNEAGLYSWQWAGCYVGKTMLRAGKEDIEVTEDIVGTVLPVRRDATTTPTMTAFTPTTDEITDTINPYIINDGYVVVNSDPDATGASGLTRIPTLETWEFDWDNGMISKAYWDGLLVYKAYPGVQKCVVRYTYVNESKRPAEWEDFVASLNTQFVPFFASMAVNNGTLTASKSGLAIGDPDWRAFGVAVPTTVITKAEPTRAAVGDTIGMSIEADATLGPTGDQLASFFVVNNVLAAY